MVAASLLTRKSPDEETLPTLKETYATMDEKPRLVWGVLAAIMIAIYAIFD